jgi:hypothetical protein
MLIGLLLNFVEISRKPIYNRRQVTNLPHIEKNRRSAQRN